jgi:hypothetical protein
VGLEERHHAREEVRRPSMEPDKASKSLFSSTMDENAINADSSSMNIYAFDASCSLVVKVKFKKCKETRKKTKRRGGVGGFRPHPACRSQSSVVPLARLVVREKDSLKIL